MIVNKATAHAAAEVLGVTLDELTSGSLGRAYRNKSRYYHPDVAQKYDEEKWAAICHAKNVLLKWLDQRPDGPGVPEGTCRACGGTGRIRVTKTKGFSARVVTVMCVMCNGAGTIPEEKNGTYQGE